MKLAIFGATGTVGRHLVAQALERGHEVTVQARRPERLGLPEGAVRAVAGDVRDPEVAARAVAGQDAVICAIGMPLLDRSGLRAAGTAAIVRAMQDAGVRRLVCLSALGAGESRGWLPWRYRRILAPTLMRWMFADHDAQERIVRESGLDWTLARPGNFDPGPARGDFLHGFTRIDRSVAIRIAPGDVAGFMLGQVGARDYLHRAAALSW